MNEVKVVSVTQPLVEGVASAEEFLAYVARVSNPSNQLNSETAPKLIKYLMKNKHWSPFEIVHLTLEIRTTRDIARQILRHRSFSFQEFSQRYAAVTDFSEPRELRLQDVKNRQNSISLKDVDEVPMAKLVDPDTFESHEKPLAEYWESEQRRITSYIKHKYEWAIASGIAKEQARVILPEGLTMSTMYMSGSLRSWMHYCDLRCDNGTQKEHREVADLARAAIDELFPSVKAARAAIVEDEQKALDEFFQRTLLERATRNEYGDYVVHVT